MGADVEIPRSKHCSLRTQRLLANLVRVERVLTVEL